MEYPFDTALPTFLSTDFSAFLQELTVEPDPSRLDENVQSAADSVACRLRPFHPFLKVTLLPRIFEKDKAAYLRQRLLEMQTLLRVLTSIVDAAFLMDGSILYTRNRDKSLAAKFAALSDVMRAERCVYVNG